MAQFTEEEKEKLLKDIAFIRGAAWLVYCATITLGLTFAVMQLLR